MDNNCECDTVFVGSRKSQLALIQTNTIIDALKESCQGKKFEIVPIATLGDKILDVALAKIGEKSLFTKELEEALLDGRVHFVVHSLKDLPTVLPEGLVIGAVYRRDDPHDAVVMHPQHQAQTLDTLPSGSIIGTSSARRTAQLKKTFPHLTFKDIRGNLNTRLRKLDNCDAIGEPYDAIILAVAGLERMNWGHRISQILSPSQCMYSVCQGAMAVECCHDDIQTLSMLSRLQDYDSTVRCTAERAFLKTLEGGCSVPVCVHTTLVDNQLTLRGGVYNLDGTESVIDSMTTTLHSNQVDSMTTTLLNNENSVTEQPSPSRDFASIVPNALNPNSVHTAYVLGEHLARKLLQDGADTILHETKRVMAEAILAEKAKRSGN